MANVVVRYLRRDAKFDYFSIAFFDGDNRVVKKRYVHFPKESEMSERDVLELYE